LLVMYVRLLCLFSTPIFQILHITFVYSEGGMDSQGYAWSVGHQSLVNLAQLFKPFVPMGGCPKHVVHALEMLVL
jgi:hypothetical protein